MDFREELIHIVDKSGAHPAWGVKHCYRVYYLAKELSNHLTLDDEVLYTAALLHDTGKYPVYALKNVDHTLRSKGVTTNLLQQMMFSPTKLYGMRRKKHGWHRKIRLVQKKCFLLPQYLQVNHQLSIFLSHLFSPTKLPIILDAVENHMYYSEPGRSDEAVYIRESDILDNLGNIGLMRLFSLVGQDELIQTPENALDRARLFAEALPDKVSTKAGKRLAVKRREEILRFLAGIKRQTSEYAWI